ncbi:lytic transglycosylase domain-containing protein [Nitrospira sp. Kam-Ns4a]
MLLVAVPLSSVSSAPSGTLPELACETAESCYRAVLAARPAARLRGDQLQAQVERLRLVQERHPGTVWARRAGLLRGVLLLQQEPAEAVRFLRAAQRDFPMLDDYVRLWMGEALLNEGEPAHAVAWLESVPEAAPDTLLQTRVAARLGQAWARLDQCGRASAWLTKAVALGPQEPTAAPSLLLLADCQAKESRPADSLAALRQLWVRYPQTPEAREAEARLRRSVGNGDWTPTPEDLFERALSFANLALHAEAVDELQKFLAAAPAHPQREAALLRLGTSLARLRRYEQARPVFQALAAEPGPSQGEAVVWLARAHLRLGDGERLLALRQALSKWVLTAEQRASVLMIVGTWHEDQGQDELALAAYQDAARLGGGQRAEAFWRIGWIRYRTGQYRQAAETFEKVLAGKDETVPPAQALYWTARSLERLGDKGAADRYRQVCRQYPFTYYCQLARIRTEVGVAVAAEGPAAQSVAGGDEAIVGDAHYRRAVELKLLGLEAEAAREVGAVLERFAGNRRLLLALTQRLSEAGAYGQALRIARLHFRDHLEKGGDGVPPGLWHVAYPTGHLATIRAHAGGSVDPFLVAALIREESQYDTQAVSRVGALGLMQLMLQTAQTVAKQLGGADVLREDLFDEETNIRLGVAYLGGLLRQFSGNVVHAVAAYNAGPAAVSAWIAKYGTRDPDEFVELIPFQETRQYVKRVLRSYREYHRLAGSNSCAASLDKVC